MGDVYGRWLGGRSPLALILVRFGWMSLPAMFCMYLALQSAVTLLPVFCTVSI